MANIERIVTHGTFELDGGSWEVDNNIWLVGDDTDVVVFDAAHTAAPIVDAVGGRNVVAVVCTHGHNDHVTVAPELGDALDAPVLLHPADDMLWRMTHPDKNFRAVSDDEPLSVAGLELHALHTPGHSPGRCAGTPRTWARCSAATPCSPAGPAPPDGHSPTSRPSCNPSQAGSAPCPATPSSTPATATPPHIGDEIVHYDEWVARRPLAAVEHPALFGLEFLLRQRPGIPQCRQGFQLLDLHALVGR